MVRQSRQTPRLDSLKRLPVAAPKRQATIDVINAAKASDGDVLDAPTQIAGTSISQKTSSVSKKPKDKITKITKKTTRPAVKTRKTKASTQKPKASMKKTKTSMQKPKASKQKTKSKSTAKPRRRANKRATTC